MPRKPSIKKLDLYGIIEVGTSDPAVGDNGELFYNTTDSTLKIYIDGGWVDIGTGTGTGSTFDFIDGTDFMFVDGTNFDFITA